MTYELQDVKGDGSCFFRALYQSAKEYNQLDTVLGVFQHEGKRFCDMPSNSYQTRTHEKRARVQTEEAVPITPYQTRTRAKRVRVQPEEAVPITPYQTRTRAKRARAQTGSAQVQTRTDPEEGFAICARQFLQSVILDEAEPYNYRDTLIRTSELIRAVGSRDAKSMFPVPMVLATFQSSNNTQFLEKMSKKIGELTTFVYEAEVLVIKEMLAKRSVKLVICTSESGIEDAINAADGSTLILFCEDNAHYKWVKYTKTIGGKKKPAARGFAALTVVELREKCRARGLKVSGTKEALICALRLRKCRPLSP